MFICVYLLLLLCIGFYSLLIDLFLCVVFVLLSLYFVCRLFILVYLLCFLGAYSHLIAFSDEEILSKKQLLEILKSIKDDRNNLSYLEMSNLINN